MPLRFDVIEMGRGFLLDESEWKPWILPDGTPCKVPGYLNLEQRGEDWWLLTDQGHELGVQKAGCLYFEQARFPLMERGIEGDDFADLPDYLGQTIWAGVPHPGAHLPLDDAGLAEMARRAEALRASTDRAIVGLFGGNFFEMPQWLYRMDNYLMYLAACPDDVIRLSQALCAIYLSNLEKWLGAVGPYIDIILFGDDLGGQNGPFLSADMYRRYYKPYHRRLTRRAKELANVKTMLHCCGSIKPLLGDLVEAGFDAINPVQISCADMESGSLKREFGHAMTFWGRRLRHSSRAANRYPTRRGRSCQTPGADLRCRWWICLPAGPQHSGRCADRECARHVSDRSRAVRSGFCHQESLRRSSRAIISGTARPKADNQRG